jgi:sec-independent protein translocase protein TatC
MTTPEASETFISHLIELRNRLLRSVIAILVVFVALFPFARDLYALLAQPLLAALPKGGQMIATDVTTPFLVPMKVAMMAAFLIALPYVLYQVWSYVAPGMYKHEKRLALPLIVSSVLLFFIGMAFAYFLVFPVVFGFISSTAPVGVAVMTDINKYLDFVLTLFVAFGVTFEVPVVVIVLVQMGMVSVAKLKEIRPYVVVGAFVIGAIFTPPDVVSQIMLAVPLWLLYELGILLAGFLTKRAPPGEEYHIMTDEQMDRELDEVEARQKEL